MYRFLTLASLATAILAQPVQHHVHKREAEPVNKFVTVHYTQVVTADAAAASAVNSAAAGLQSAEVNSDVANNANSAYSAPAPQVNTAPSAAPTPASTFSTVASQAPSSASSAAPAQSSSAGGSDSGASGHGITYSPYSNNGGCKSASQVKSDLSQLSEYSVIRIYGTDCNQVENVMNALGDNQKAFVGIFDVGNIDGDCQTIKSAVEGSGKGWDSIHTVSIGNELVNSGQASVSQIKSYTSQARGTLRGYGYKGPVVAVDTFIAMINNPDLCEASDYAAANAHAYFDGGVTAEEAGDWALLQIQRVWSACGGKKSVMITESGWPSSGESNGKAVPSESNMKAAVSSLKDKVGNDVILFTAFNDKWKSPGYKSVEQSFGIYGDSSN